MREIKFRAWDKKRNRFIVFLEKICLNKNGISFVYERDESSPTTPNIYSIGDVELMQYTGLKDKNKKEIYEGDILEWVDKFSLNLVRRDIAALPDRFQVIFEDGAFIALGIDKQGGCKSPGIELKLSAISTKTKSC